MYVSQLTPTTKSPQAWGLIVRHWGSSVLNLVLVVFVNNLSVEKATAFPKTLSTLGCHMFTACVLACVHPAFAPPYHPVPICDFTEADGIIHMVMCMNAAS